MLSLKPRNQLAIGLSLFLLMAATREHHFGTLHHLPDASWAIFFLAGAYLRLRWPFLVFTALAAGIDWAAITWAGVSDFCVTPAYAMLLPSYGILWLGGRWFAQRHTEAVGTLRPLIAAVLVSAFAAEVLASGSFYFFGGRFADPTMTEFMPRLFKYFPAMFAAMALYVSLAAIVHSVLTLRKAHAVDAQRSYTSGIHR